MSVGCRSMARRFGYRRTGSPCGSLNPSVESARVHSGDGVPSTGYHTLQLRFASVADPAGAAALARGSSLQWIKNIFASS